MADERKLKLATVKLLLKERQPEAACGILWTMDDPTATKWLEQLGTKQARKTQRLHGICLSAVAILLCIALGAGWLLGQGSKPDLQGQLSAESTAVYALTATAVQPTVDAIQSRNLTVEAILTATASE